MFHNIFEFASAIFCIDRAQVPQVAHTEKASKRLYRHSPRGLSLMPLRADGTRAKDDDFVWGVKVLGIVEGTDIEYSSTPLMFPFGADEFWRSVSDAADALDDAEAEWDAQSD